MHSKSTTEWNDIFQQAKAMFEEQIIESHIHGHNAPSRTLKHHDAKHYYNETYKEDKP